MYKKYPSFSTSIHAAIDAVQTVLPPAAKPAMSAQEAAVREQIRILTPVYEQVKQAYDRSKLTAHQAVMTQATLEMAHREAFTRLHLLNEELKDYLPEQADAEWEHA